MALGGVTDDESEKDESDFAVPAACCGMVPCDEHMDSGNYSRQ